MKKALGIVFTILITMMASFIPFIKDNLVIITICTGIIFVILFVVWAEKENEIKNEAKDKALKIAYNRWLEVLKEAGLTITKNGKEYPNYSLMGKSYSFSSSIGPAYGTDEEEIYQYYSEFQGFEELLSKFQNEEIKKLDL